MAKRFVRIEPAVYDTQRSLLAGSRPDRGGLHRYLDLLEAVNNLRAEEFLLPLSPEELFERFIGLSKIGDAAPAISWVTEALKSGMAAKFSDFPVPTEDVFVDKDWGCLILDVIARGGKKVEAENVLSGFSRPARQSKVICGDGRTFTV